MSPPALLDMVGGLADMPMINIVDVGANPLGGEKGPYQRLVDSGLATLVGFEPDPRGFRLLQHIKGPNETYLPIAVGDGKRHRMRICAKSGMNSLLEPNFALLDLVDDYSDWAKIHNVVEMDTKRLDDMPEITAMDYLKIDIQGGELMVFQNAADRLKDCLVVHTEVMFIPLYINQPLFSEQEMFLRQLGLAMHKLCGLEAPTLKPFAVIGKSLVSFTQFFGADVIFIKDITRLAQLSADQLLKLAVILQDIYGSSDVAHLALQAYDRKAGTAYATRFLTALVGAAPRD